MTVLLTAMVVAACSRETVQEQTATMKEKVESVVERVSVPRGRPGDPAAREKERFDSGWRSLTAFQRQQQAKIDAERARAAAAQKINFVRGAKESLKGLTPDAINGAPVSVPITGDVAGPSVLRTQVYLDRAGFSVGAIDGRWGKNSAVAVWWFQRSRGIPATGDVDEQTYRALYAEGGAAPAVVAHQLSAADLEGPFTSIPEDVYEQAKLDCLCYESAAEKIAERFHIDSALLEALNPNVDLGALQAGQTLNVLNVRPPVTAARPDVARVMVSLRGNSFDAFDAAGNVLFHAPTTVGSQYDPSPTETVEIKKVTPDPHFHYQPKLFHEVPDDEPEANLNPGPNSPVGVVWIALSKPHYGIHGTSDPESIGYASSHGCIRLTNWDARELAQRVQPGVKVEFVDTRQQAAASQ
jgi:lipoprotein-anchoring transpeptidase ErfK/SrfK